MPHIHEKIDFTVEVFVVHKDRVLLRKHDKYGIWLSVGGHVELDEDPNEAAIREVREEVGLEIELYDSRIFKEDGVDRTELIPPIGLYGNRISETHEHVTMVYFARAWSDAVIPETEKDEWRWCRKDEIRTLENIREDVVFYAEYALEKLGGQKK